MDFTLKKYKQLLEILIAKRYTFVRFDEFVKSETSDVKSERQEASGEQRPFGSTQDERTLSDQPYALCILRHDVDREPGNSLATAKIESELGIKSTYYFRIVPESFDEKIIKKIAGLGHEIGYHYEELDTAYRQLKIKNSKLKIEKSNGTILQSNNDTSTSLSMTKPQSDNNASSLVSPDRSGQAARDDALSMAIDLAYEMFKKNLEKMRGVAEIKTICMHGSPLSKFDNKAIWSKYGYKRLGLFGEPYFDLDWNEFGYLTDTGRCWNGSNVSVRDKVESKFKFNFKSTKDIIVNIDRLPDHIMITVHPQRWTDSYFAWGKELVWQNVKNVVKRFIMMHDE